MVFTLVSQLQDSLRSLVEQRVSIKQKEAAEIERREIEVRFSGSWFLSSLVDADLSHCIQKEEARTKGTPVTPITFLEWKKRFDKERAARLALEDEERMKAMIPKEREEFKKSQSKLTGKISHPKRFRDPFHIMTLDRMNTPKAGNCLKEIGIWWTKMRWDRRKVLFQLTCHNMIGRSHGKTRKTTVMQSTSVIATE